MYEEQLMATKKQRKLSMPSFRHELSNAGFTENVFEHR